MISQKAKMKTRTKPQSIPTPFRKKPLANAGIKEKTFSDTNDGIPCMFPACTTLLPRNAPANVVLDVLVPIATKSEERKEIVFVC